MAFEPPQDLRSIDALIEIMARLRDPDGGCPWDLEQDFASIAPYTIEEAYEVFDAIERKDFPHLKDELGDLLFQAVYHGQMASEAGHFNFADVVESVCEKMIRRHPHVFADANQRTSESQTAAWEEIKAAERAARGEDGATTGVLDGLPLALPALLRSLKLQKRAARVGFDWPDMDGAWAKLREEIEEFEKEVKAGDTERLLDEFGDVLFAFVNVGRFLSIDPENALRGANMKFVRRFEYIEAKLALQGKAPHDVDLDVMEALWIEAKGFE
jgi:nucleoside triphosphate diphosphatase